MFFFVIIIFAVFISRLFYLQIINHDYYTALAVDSQERKFEIDAQRGTISLMDREDTKPLVLNENLPTVFMDPSFIDAKEATAVKLAELLGGRSDEYLASMNQDSSYVVIARQVSLKTAKAIDKAGLKGVGTIDQYYRSYPEGELAAHVVGFVNSDGDGQYGIEQYLDEELQGVDGRVEAITDVSGIPLRGDSGNILSDAVPGDNVVLTIDANVQKQVEEAVKKAVKNGRAKRGAAVVIDPHSGAIKAMANYPTFNPSKYSEVKDQSVFINDVVSSPYEVGSVIKTLTMATGIDNGVVSRTSTYYDPGYVKVDDWTIENAGVAVGGQTRTMDNVIQKSVNTGAVHVLKQLGGGKINEKARKTLYDYFVNHFGLGAITGIEQANEVAGTVFEPNEGDGLNIRYANMTFGQGMTNTMIQVAGAISALVTDGTYYKPYLVHSTTNNDNNEIITDPILLRNDVVSASTSKDLRAMMKLAVDDGGGRSAKKAGYNIGGKTGTAQVPLSDGSYSDSREIGSFAGYIEGGDGVEYVIVTRVDEPQGYLFAGSGAAAPLFADIAHFLIDFDRIPPVE